MEKYLEKTKVLIEALPYIKKFYGKTIVIKYGGHAMVSDQLKEAVINDLVLMKFVGINPVVVHGGGPEISRMLNKLNIKSNFINGLRVTDEATLEVVEMVLVGKVNKEIVGLIEKAGGKAVGLSGKDAGLIKAHKKLAKNPEPTGEEYLDLGYVGEISEVNPEILLTLIDKGYIPVVAPVGSNGSGEFYNINADEVAAEVAVALKADKLIVLTDTPGILLNEKDENSLLSKASIAEVKELINRGVIRGGMIPKAESAISAIKRGVGSVHIIDGRIAHSLLLEIFTDAGVGTMLTP
ncbi:acetylglutamate kinase [Carboxydothermus pertinax]|uniref:Acetylglutamate kinase n=1 Tax=Carboxydothermus pertinax TaxID=870242 RepID=A0A1L8CY72_9THEO|nr:acetylglutamate kinase [Carboxydothermus pertinax]GAV23865.1 acetylglutamate kinase [Carboxydothermus pertinax]